MAEKNFFKIIDEDGEERLRFKLTITKGKVTYVVVQYETFFKEKWVEIVRYDNAHGFFHRDVLHPKGKNEKQVISIQNLEDALNYAEQDLKDNYLKYKSRYLKNL